MAVGSKCIEHFSPATQQVYEEAMHRKLVQLGKRKKHRDYQYIPCEHCAAYVKRDIFDDHMEHKHPAEYKILLYKRKHEANYKKLCNMRMLFGKHEGLTLLQLVQLHMDYVNWALVTLTNTYKNKPSIAGCLRAIIAYRVKLGIKQNE
jgi:hypothetical protein